MTPPRQRGGGRPDQRNEAARLTDQLIAEGFNRKQVAEILGRDASLVSQFFTKNKGASMVEALRAVVQEVQAGGPRDIDSLKRLARAHVRPRLTKSGERARVRHRNTVRSTRTVTDERGRRVKEWTSSLARAGKQHIAAGAPRLYPVIAEAAANNGKIAFTVRALRRMFTHDAGRLADSPGVRRNVVQRADGTEERAYGANVGGPGSGEQGFDAVQFKQLVDAAGGDVTAAVQGWLVMTGRMHPEAEIVYLEIRAWKENR
ncbi:hypothetical protein JK359_33310 [Streptomyces actinomycinicus]|uniref:Helix-turn-helix domain containing protein n=1 Tax=Streptomyces actinomycinicus TaxID=1695166 RepID=A0A937JRU8_9ACTN|nr:hypothetical protein [Streptomyces actinomycinicus]MBL1086786.1 hypothetical protein [Streptomyces actinomycinicus]